MRSAEPLAWAEHRGASGKIRELIARAQRDPAIGAEGLLALFRGPPEDPEALDIGVVGAFLLARALINT